MDSIFFTDNRKRLIGSVGAEVIVLAGWTGMQWQGDSAAPFRQEANFWYLTGIEHPGWLLVIDGAANKTWLIAPDTDTVHQLFDGSLSVEEAKAMSGVDNIIDQKRGHELLRELSKKHPTVFTLGDPPYAKYVDFVLNPAPKQLRLQLKKMFSSVKDCRKDLAKLRAIKQPAEITAMTEAAALTMESLAYIKSNLQSYRYEYEVEAEFAYAFRRHDSGHAFEPVVAGGKNACTLHYVKNSAKLLPKNLLLIDVGASQKGYPADITRTFAYGEPTKRQKAVHAAVKEAEQEIIGLLAPGLRLEDYVEAADAVMKNALLKLGLLKNLNDKAAYRRYFPHAISHGLGAEVHESLGGYKELQPGMVLTVEPGIYIPEEGIGVRIEDDILITSSGYDNLTSHLSTDL